MPLEHKRPLLHDQYPVHRCKNVLEWISNNYDIYELPLPPRSPELMPLESIRSIILKEVNAKDVLVFNSDVLWDEVSNAFQSLCSAQLVAEQVDKIPSVLINMRQRQGDSLY